MEKYMFSAVHVSATTVAFVLFTVSKVRVIITTLFSKKPGEVDLNLTQPVSKTTVDL